MAQKVAFFAPLCGPCIPRTAATPILPLRYGSSEKLQKRVLFECFPYACPEPVLVKRSFSVQNGAKDLHSYPSWSRPNRGSGNMLTTGESPTLPPTMVSAAAVWAKPRSTRLSFHEQPRLIGMGSCGA